VEALIALFFIVFIANMSTTIVGFGGTLISLALAAHLFPITYLVPILILLQAICSLYLAILDRQCIQWGKLGKRILPFALVGMGIGVLLLPYLEGHLLLLIFAGGTWLFSVRELFLLWREDGKKVVGTTSSAIGLVSLTSGGILQGLYGSGGPMIVFYTSQVLPDKSEFRSTMGVLWVFLDIILFLGYIQMGRVTLDTITTTGMLLPALWLGILVGDPLHRKISERKFRFLLYGLVIASTSALIIGKL